MLMFPNVHLAADNSNQQVKSVREFSNSLDQIKISVTIVSNSCLFLAELSDVGKFMFQHDGDQVHNMHETADIHSCNFAKCSPI